MGSGFDCDSAARARGLSARAKPLGQGLGLGAGNAVRRSTGAQTYVAFVAPDVGEPSDGAGQRWGALP